MYSSFIATSDPRNALTLYLTALSIISVVFVLSDLETILLKALANDPGQRYGTSSELLADLCRLRARLNPLPPQYCYLKPHYLDVQASYFDHVARGAL